MNFHDALDLHSLTYTTPDAPAYTTEEDATMSLPTFNPYVDFAPIVTNTERPKLNHAENLKWLKALDRVTNECTEYRTQRQAEANCFWSDCYRAMVIHKTKADALEDSLRMRLAKLATLEPNAVTEQALALIDEALGYKPS